MCYISSCAQGEAEKLICPPILTSRLFSTIRTRREERISADARNFKFVITHQKFLAKGGEEIMAQMYCVKCRAKRDDPNAQKVTMKNGKPALKGKCPTCGTGMYKIGG